MGASKAPAVSPSRFVFAKAQSAGSQEVRQPDAGVCLGPALMYGSTIGAECHPVAAFEECGVGGLAVDCCVDEPAGSDLSLVLQAGHPENPRPQLRFHLTVTRFTA